MEFKPIAFLHNDFPTKFGLPRQSGMADSLVSRVVMEKEYQNPEAFRGIEEFEYLWLLAVFVADGTSAEARRQQAYGRFCHALTEPPEPDCADEGQAFVG